MKKTLFWLLILALLIYSGIKFGTPYYRYWAFKADAKEIVKVSLENEAEVKNKIFERAKELKIPIDSEDIEISSNGKVMRVKTSWFEVVDIGGIYQKTLKFNVDTGE